MRLECTANFFTRHAWKLQVQHDYTGGLLSKAFQASNAVRRDLHRESIRFEQALQRALHWPTVFYNEYRIHAILWSGQKMPGRAKPRKMQRVLIIYNRPAAQALLSIPAAGKRFFYAGMKR